jgi:hypothetical protein
MDSLSFGMAMSLWWNWLSQTGNALRWFPSCVSFLELKASFLWTHFSSIILLSRDSGFSFTQHKTIWAQATKRIPTVCGKNSNFLKLMCLSSYYAILTRACDMNLKCSVHIYCQCFKLPQPWGKSI